MSEFSHGGGSSSGGGAPTGAAGGDLSGTYPNPGVAKLNGVAAAAYAPLASPTFTGTVTLPSGIILPSTAAATTASAGDNTTKVATDQFVTRSVMTPSGYFRGGSSATRRETIPRILNRAAATLTSGTLLLTGIDYAAGDVVSFFGFQVTANTTFGSTGGTMHWYLALYDSSRNLLCSTADQGSAVLTTTGGVGSGAWYKVAVGRDAAGNAASTYTVATAGSYMAGIMLFPGTGGSPASGSIGSYGLTNNAAGTGSNVDGMSWLGATADTALTSGTPPGQPSSTCAAFTANGNLYYIYTV